MRKTVSARRVAGAVALYLIIALALAFAPPLQSAPISHLGTDQKVLVICVTWDDQASTRLNSCDDWATVLGNEVGAFYDAATFGQTTFVFEAPSGAPNNGWLALGYDSSDYGFAKTGQDAIDLADPFVDFTQYHRVAVVTNHSNFGGQGTSGWWWATGEGTEADFVEDGDTVSKRFMSLSIVNEWEANLFGLPFDEAGAVIAHELGHHLAVKTHYGSIGWFPGSPRDVMTPWGVMGLSPYMNHFLGWAKLEREWLPVGAVQSFGPPDTSDIDTTVTLSPLENGSGTRLIELPITDGPVFTGYVVENRQQINGDENLPEAGVLVSFVDENPNTIRKAVVLDDPGSPGDLNQAALEVGDSYTDAERNLTITAVSQSGDDVDVRVQYLLPPAQPPNPQITPWGAPPWETVDIWIDSEKNGWGTYKYTDGSGNPIGNGDDAWVDHDNRVYFRITNGGLGPASNVRVQVYVNEPPGMGDSGADWKFIGAAMFPSLAAGASEEGYVTWKPTIGEHTCLKVQILETDTEITPLDNIAQENVTAFDTSPGSPYRAQCRRFTVNNPFEHRSTPVHILVRDVPEGWKIQVEPLDFTLAPGASDEICTLIFPPEPGGEYVPGYIGQPKLEALVPFANTFVPIGGIDIWTHLTDASRLTCDTTGSGRLDAQPDESADRMGTGLAPLPGEGGAGPPRDAEALEDLFKDAALIRPEAELATVAAGEVIEADGRLEPGFSGATIAVDFISGDRRVTRLTTTDASGRWTASYDPEVGGLWEVKAYFAGDRLRAAADSNRCRFEVDRPGGCDFDPRVARVVNWFATLLALLAAALFVAAVRQRICWAALVAALLFLFLALLPRFFCLQWPAALAWTFFLIAAAILIWWYRICVRGRDKITAG